MANGSTGSGGGRDTRLTEAGIYAAALALVDAGGVEGLSMRKLAAALGVNPMSLYHHVENKAALLTGVTRLVAAELGDLDAPTGTWQQRLRALAYDFRELSRRHRGLVVYAFTSPHFNQREASMWPALGRVLRAAGLPEPDVDQVAAVLVSLVGGLLLTEANGVLRRYADPDGVRPGRVDDRGFEIAVDMLIAGVEARL